MSDGILETMTIDDVQAFDPEVVVICIASTEPHGPHLPYGTDVYIGDGLCRQAVRRANEQGARVLMYPTLPVANNVNFKGLPFACRVRVRTLMLMMRDIIEALEEDGIRKIVLVNSHGGNRDTLRAVLREHVDRHPPDEQVEHAFVCTLDTGDMCSEEAVGQIQHMSAHAGEYETSLMMHLQPDLVRNDELTDLPVQQPDVSAVRERGIHFVRQWHQYMPRSGGGECRSSTPEKGQLLGDSAVERMAEVLIGLAEAPWTADFPYGSGG